jgi:hypothetical protein
LFVADFEFIFDFLNVLKPEVRRVSDGRDLFFQASLFLERTKIFLLPSHVSTFSPFLPFNNA